VADAAEHPRLDELLALWVRWTHQDDLRHLDCEVTRYWSAASSDFDSMVDDADRRDAETLDTCLWSLPPDLCASILHKHAGATWRLRRTSIEDAYARARRALSDSLRRRGVP
jgi:hypothetical protein